MVSSTQRIPHICFLLFSYITVGRTDQNIEIEKPELYISDADQERRKARMKRGHWGLDGTEAVGSRHPAGLKIKERGCR